MIDSYVAAIISEDYHNLEKMTDHEKLDFLCFAFQQFADDPEFIPTSEERQALIKLRAKLDSQLPPS